MAHPSSTASGTPIEAPIVAFARSDVEPGASEIGTHPSGVETGTLGGSVPIDVAEASEDLELPVSLVVAVPNSRYLGSFKLPSLRKIRPSPVSLSQCVPAPLQYQ